MTQRPMVGKRPFLTFEPKIGALGIPKAQPTFMFEGSETPKRDTPKCG